MPDFEQELVALRREIATVSAEEASERQTADQLVASMRDSGANMRDADNFAKIDEAYKGADAKRDHLASLRSQQARWLEISGGTREPESRAEAQQARAFAARFLDSPEYRSLVKSAVLKTRGSRVNMDPVLDVITRDEMESSGLRLRTTFDNSANIGSGLLTPDYTGKVVEQLVRRVRFLDLITIGATDTDTVDYVIENSRTDAAAPTPYGTAVPESAYGFSHVQTTVKRLGHFVPATKGILADAGQTRTLLSSRLVTGLELQVETQALSGSGAGENLRGLLNVSGGLAAQALGADTRLDAIHKAITQIVVATNGQVYPTAIGMSPADYEKVVLDKDSTGRYKMADPTSGANPTVWGLTPIVSPLFTSGTPVLGDFKEACTLWLREGVSVSASDSHNDFFLKGLVALMAESRMAFATTRKEAVCTVTGF